MGIFDPNKADCFVRRSTRTHVIRVALAGGNLGLRVLAALCACSDSTEKQCNFSLQLLQENKFTDIDTNFRVVNKKQLVSLIVAGWIIFNVKVERETIYSLTFIYLNLLREKMLN